MDEVPEGYWKWLMGWMRPVPDDVRECARKLSVRCAQEHLTVNFPCSGPECQVARYVLMIAAGQGRSSEGSVTTTGASPAPAAPAASELAAALRKLRNEASAIAELAEPGIREWAGNTNLACLKLRIAEADALLLALDATK